MSTRTSPNLGQNQRETQTDSASISTQQNTNQSSQKGKRKLTCSDFPSPWDRGPEARPRGHRRENPGMDSPKSLKSHRWLVCSPLLERRWEKKLYQNSERDPARGWRRRDEEWGEEEEIWGLCIWWIKREIGFWSFETENVFVVFAANSFRISIFTKLAIFWRATIIFAAEHIVNYVFALIVF